MKVFFGLSSPKKSFPLFSWGIRLFYGVEYSHIMIFWYSDTAGEPIFYEASGRELKFLGSSAFHERANIKEVWSRVLTKEQQAQLTGYCMRKAGTKYGTMQALGIFVAKLFGLRKNPFSRGSNQQVCSEIVGRIIEDCFNESTHLDLDMAGPPEIRQYLHDSPLYQLEWSRIIK